VVEKPSVELVHGVIVVSLIFFDGKSAAIAVRLPTLDTLCGSKQNRSGRTEL